MVAVSLKSLHAYLKLLENPSELKKRLPASSNPRTLKEGAYELSRLVGVDESVFREPQQIAALIGAQRLLVVWGEVSVTDHVVRLFDASRLLLTVLVNPAYSGNGTSSQKVSGAGGAPQQGGALAAHSAGSAHSRNEPLGAEPSGKSDPGTTLEGLSDVLSGNTPLFCRLFRAIFEEMIGFASPANAPQATVSLVHELTGNKEHARSLLATALFILGAELDRDNLMSFMMHQALFGLPLFEHLLLRRDYCDAYYSFRRLERAFMGSPAAEEAQLRQRFDQFNAQFGGKPCGAKIFEGNEQDKARFDACLAAMDVLEALALTPWSVSLNHAVALASSNSIRSAGIIAGHFGRVGGGAETKERANQGIAEHLFAFARQFSADLNPA